MDNFFRLYKQSPIYVEPTKDRERKWSEKEGRNLRIASDDDDRVERVRLLLSLSVLSRERRGEKSLHAEGGVPPPVMLKVDLLPLFASTFYIRSASYHFSY